MRENNDELSIANQHLNQAYFYEENGNPTQALKECDIVIATSPLLLAEAYKTTNRPICQTHLSISTYTANIRCLTD
jgi:hypothetical protein